MKTDFYGKGKTVIYFGLNMGSNFLCIANRTNEQT